MPNTKLEAIIKEAKRWKTTAKTLEQSTNGRHLQLVLDQRNTLWDRLVEITEIIDTQLSFAKIMADVSQDPMVGDAVRAGWNSKVRTLEQLSDKIYKQPPERGE